MAETKSHITESTKLDWLWNSYNETLKGIVEDEINKDVCDNTNSATVVLIKHERLETGAIVQKPVTAAQLSKEIEEGQKHKIARLYSIKRLIAKEQNNGPAPTSKK